MKTHPCYIIQPDKLIDGSIQSQILLSKKDILFLWSAWDYYRVIDILSQWKLHTSKDSYIVIASTSLKLFLVCVVWGLWNISYWWYCLQWMGKLMQCLYTKILWDAIDILWIIEQVLIRLCIPRKSRYPTVSHIPKKLRYRLTIPFINLLYRPDK